MPPLVLLLSIVTISLTSLSAAEPRAALQFAQERLFEISLGPDSPVGAASIREHAVAWHPARRKFYLVADVVPLASPHHPNTYDTELGLWSSADLKSWTFHGIAVPKGTPDRDYDGYGVASPAGMVFHNGRLYVPFSARRTARFDQRAIGLARSSRDPEQVPWTKSAAPISDIANGEDDDPALAAIPGDARLHLYHRTTLGGYHVVHTASATPDDPASWPAAAAVTARPNDVRAQELTGVAVLDGRVRLFTIDHTAQGIRIAHLTARDPAAMFGPFDPDRRYLDHQPRNLAYGGHFTPIVRDGVLVAASWTVVQSGKRYGVAGHAATLSSGRSD